MESVKYESDRASSAPSSQPAAPAVVREQPGGQGMRAIILEKFGGLDSLVYADIPKPLPKMGEIVIEVKGFGINHAELHMRRGEWAESAEVSGIEYSELPWSQLAALPETYATAWTCLFRNLNLRAGQTLVIRGATSSFGQAAVKMAVAADARVIATTRSPSRFAMLEKLGAAPVEVEVPDLAAHIAEAKQVDAVLDLVGNSTILDSLDMLRRGGTACLAGWPLSDVPLQDIAGQVADGRLDAKPSRVFTFDEIHEAHPDHGGRRSRRKNGRRGPMFRVVGDP
jgi:NADPH:quinone reductase